MALDWTGIENINGFYTAHYLSEYFEAKVHGAVKTWEEMREQAGADASEPYPWQGLRDRVKDSLGVAAACDRASGSEEMREILADFAQAFLHALGYRQPSRSAEPPVVFAGEAVYPLHSLHGEIRGGEKGLNRSALAVLLVDQGVRWSSILDAPVLEAYGRSEWERAEQAKHAGESHADTGAGGWVCEPAALPRESRPSAEEAATAILFESEEVPARFLLLLSSRSACLIDRNKWNEKRCFLFDFPVLAQRNEASTFKAGATLLAASSLAPAAGPGLIDELDDDAVRHAAGVSDSLKFALRESIELLGNEVIRDWCERGKSIEELDASELTTQCLRYMYRLLFLLFMEARPELGFAPMKSDVYAKGYSVQSLRDMAEQVKLAGRSIDENGTFIADTLEKAAELVYEGYPRTEAEFAAVAAGREVSSVHGVFSVPPLKAHIFDAERTPLLAAARLRDGVMLEIIDLMSVTRSSYGGVKVKGTKGKKTQRRERIAYGSLGINQLGAVYEALLSYSGFIAPEDLYEVAKDASNVNMLDVGYFVPLAELENYTEKQRVRYAKDGANGEVEGNLRVFREGTFIYRLAGREREKSASYYTPESLTKALVKHALKELLEGKSADEILQLTVCEPAMGSAAFLNEAVSQLASAYLERKEAELGISILHSEREFERQRVKMYIADRNVYGIDLNPIAVELGEVSLWLNTISADGHVPWFGNQLHAGNSLVGARRAAYTEKQLASKSKGIAWWDNEPERIGYEHGVSKSHRIYHFLVGDPGMAAYGDKVIQALEPENAALIKQWNKNFTREYADREELVSLRRLSRIVDDLWKRQIAQQRAVKAETDDALEVFGQPATVQGRYVTIREKDKVYAEAYRSEHARNAGPYARLKFAMDYWCALWFWPIGKAEELPTREEFLDDMFMILEGVVPSDAGAKGPAGQMALPLTEHDSEVEALKDDVVGVGGVVDLDKLCARFARFRIARDVAARQHFFHWDLEFADVFEARGGFDLILGNPPWVNVEFNEKNVLSDYDPRFAINKFSAKQTADNRADVLETYGARSRYVAEYEGIEGAKNFYNAAQNYKVLKGQRTNLYRCFLPQAWAHQAEFGISAFIHPEGIFNEEKAAALRAAGGARLRAHFQFANELKMFADVDHHTQFCLTVYGGPREDNTYDSIWNLYTPDTIDACYAHDGNGEVPGIKTASGQWNTAGHRERIISIGKHELETFATLLGADDWRGAPLMAVHAVSLLEVLSIVANQKTKLADCSNLLTVSDAWNETNAQKDGTIRAEVRFPSTLDESILSGAHLGVCNPCFQSTKPVYRTNSDYDLVDLTAIGDSYRIRTKYVRDCSEAVYASRIPRVSSTISFADLYRLCFRDMVGCASERTMQAAILAPGQMWINKILGFCVSTSDRMRINNSPVSSGDALAYFAGVLGSLPFDYCIRAKGKTDLTRVVIEMLPLIDTPLFEEIIVRALMLNCLTRDYAELWRECWREGFTELAWSREDARLRLESFTQLTGEWEWATPLRTDYERRQALVELDVLVSLALGLTLEQLEAVYRLDFSVLQAYEADTWYDANGRIAFSAKKMGKINFDRKTFEAIKKETGGTFPHTFTDSTMPGEPRERTIEFVAPFDMCDRIQDYRAAWAFFTQRYGLEQGERKSAPTVQ